MKSKVLQCVTVIVARAWCNQVTLDTRLSQDVEEHRLIALYEASCSKERAAAGRLLYPHHNLPHQKYLKLVGDLGVIRKDCNEKMLAVRAHHNKM
jgi:hypothetical protein